MHKYGRPLLFGALLLLAAGASAQTREEITVQVIDVPVYVFSHGKPIRNLTKDDFELFVNGKPQAIDYFDQIAFDAPEAAPAAGAKPVATVVADPRERRLFLLLFDLVFNRPAALLRAREAAAKMVNHALPQDFFAVATITSQGAGFLIPFTRDREVILRAIVKLSPSSAHDSLAISISDAERQTAEAWITEMTGSGAASEDPMSDIMAGFKPEEIQRAKNLAQGHLGSVAGIVGRLAEIEGYKHVVMFSEGFSAQLFRDGAFPDAGMTHSLKLMAEPYLAAGAFLHAVDLGMMDHDAIAPGPSAPSYSNGSNAASTPTYVRRYDDSRDETLFMLSEPTGGQLIRWTNDFAGALADLSSTLSAGYRLGFKPDNPRKGTNSISVKVKNIPRGTTVSFRNGFSTSPKARDANDRLLLADIIQNDIPQSGTPPRFAFTERPFIDVVVPSRQLAREHGAIPVANIMLYIFDDKGAAIDYREKQISISATPNADQAIRQKLELPPGSYVAKSLLRIGKSIGFAKVAFTIPDVK